MTSRPTPDERLSRALRATLAGVTAGTSVIDIDDIHLHDFLTALEYFLPRLLAEIDPYWKGESFDGFYLATATKIGTLKAELRGVCILISDQ